MTKKAVDHRNIQGRNTTKLEVVYGLNITNTYLRKTTLMTVITYPRQTMLSLAILRTLEQEYFL